MSQNSTPNKTKYRGVTYLPNTNNKPYRAQFQASGKKVLIGYFDTAQEAHKAYEEHAQERRALYTPPVKPAKERLREARGYWVFVDIPGTDDTTNEK